MRLTPVSLTVTRSPSSGILWHYVFNCERAPPGRMAVPSTRPQADFPDAKVSHLEVREEDTAAHVSDRGSIPVAISLAIYQSTPVSEVFTSLGFLVAIIAVVTVNLLPRAKLIQMTFGICVSTAIAIPLAMLATWSGLQARFHTDPEGLHAYNSSQSGQSSHRRTSTPSS